MPPVLLGIVWCALSQAAEPVLAAAHSVVEPQAGAAARAQSPGYAVGPQRCNRLTELMRGRWPDSTTRVLQAAWRTAGTTAAMPLAPPVSLPPHCELTGTLRQRTGIDGKRYAIRFHLRLPERWNGRFLFEGGGGSEGDLGSAIGTLAIGTPSALSRGFAVVSEDSGHDNSIDSDPARGGAVAFGLDPEARANYGGASLKPVADAAKAVIDAYYGQPPERSYFYGCSKGGQEGMVFAQRYPGEFDGIVAADPGFSLPRAAVAEAWDTQAFASLVADPRTGRIEANRLPASFSDAQLDLVRGAVLDACDADDGVRDGITAAFGRCTWPKVAVELRRRMCARATRNGQGSPEAEGPAERGERACLTDGQIAVLKRVYGGPKDSHGRALYADWPLDAGIGSAAWRLWKIGPAGGGFPGINVAMGATSLAEVFTTPPTALHADVESALGYALRFDFDRDAPKIYATGGAFHRSAWAVISARSPHLEAFRARGGKLIVPQGASDPVFSLNDTLAWYREVDALEHGTAASFVRVFPVPGMAHCNGGPATDEFDAFAALVAWVEKGTAPARILARAGRGSPWPGRTRPLCPYPKIARYKGSGSIEDAANFRCE